MAIGPESPPMDRPARITLSLGAFMMLLLIAVPFALESDSEGGYFASYLIYSLFLTSVGVIIGVSLTWVKDPGRAKEPLNEVTTPRNPMLSGDQKQVVAILSENSGSMWQSELVSQTGFTDSKASRVLSRMEAEGHIRRVRDGMSKRVELTRSEMNG